MRRSILRIAAASTLCAAMLLLVTALPADAKIVLPGIFGDNMVLQQNSNVKIWGWGTPDSMIEIKVSWNRTAVNAKCGPDGKWSAFIKTPAASYEPQRITVGEIRTAERVALTDVLVGEVWFCSGQSNMEIPLKGFYNCPIEGSNEAIAESGRHPGVRVGMVQRNSPRHPVDTCSCRWLVPDPSVAADFSAVAYFFAVKLNEALNVPVGVLVSDWGGSRVEGWLPEEVLKGYPDIDLKQLDDPNNDSYYRPEVMYNGMLHPLAGYTIRGAIWYQGESNVGCHDTYPDRLGKMISLWRSEWGQGDFPFYIVEIAPFDYFSDDQDEMSAFLREAQYKVSVTVPNCGYVCTNDLLDSYEATNIHPKRKAEIGQRLSWLALVKTYGAKGIAGVSPSYRPGSMKVADGKATLSFDNLVDGFNRMDGLEGFEIAGRDSVFHPATAKVVDVWNIEVSSPDVSEPVAVRYCFHDFQVGNVRNSRWLPLVPFRTDAW
jgi:sialate O-acetylesterase